MTVQTITVVEWGLLYEGPSPHIESFGTTPDGTVRQFDEGDVRYMARSGNRRVVSRTKTIVTTDWVES